MSTTPGWSAALAIALATLAGCAAKSPSTAPASAIAPAPAPATREADIRITRIERARWDAPPEPNLFRVEFSATVTRDIRRRADYLESGGMADPYRAEMEAMQEEADRELRARGLCAEGARVVAVLDAPHGSPTVSGQFRCRPKGGLF